MPELAKKLGYVRLGQVRFGLWTERDHCFLIMTDFLFPHSYGSSASKAMALRGGENRRKDGKLWVSERLRDFKLPQRFDLGKYL